MGRAQVEMPRFPECQGAVATVRELAPTCLLGQVSRKGLVIALATWDSSGKLVRWTPVDGEGRRHGIERELAGGKVQWQVPWVRGAMHGLSKQFDTRGKLLIIPRFTA